ncbi:hypothetical protein [Wolbachia endosymbiont (group B) of Eucosma cana]|uniref:hypothetical protein n=1 Tax=Wolbachia endosymbiont (group B) of Eucosma cana TaxID=2954012 RepID=UPI002227A25D|nr:hypothetical protein [Wolbachia endosymbiont (group B) of Eucosma cana]
MSKKMINELKAKVKERGYAHLKSTKSSDYRTYKDLDMDFNSEYEFACDLVINGKAITNDFIKNLYLKHKDLIPKDEKGNYRPFLKQIFKEIFEHAGAAVPNDPIMEELITYYNRSGYKQFFSSQSQALRSFGLWMYSFHYLIPSYRESTYISCEDPNCLKFSFSVNDGIYNDNKILVCNLQNSVEFKLKCEGENVKYEEGKVSLTIPKELKNYKANDKNLFDVIIEYFQKFCEKFGFHFETKIEHILDKPLGVLSDINTFQDKNLNLKNLK